MKSKEHQLLMHDDMFHFVNQLLQLLDDSLFSFRYLFIVLPSSTIKHKKWSAIKIDTNLKIAGYIMSSPSVEQMPDLYFLESSALQIYVNLTFQWLWYFIHQLKIR